MGPQDGLQSLGPHIESLLGTCDRPFRRPRNHHSATAIMENRFRDIAAPSAPWWWTIQRAKHKASQRALQHPALPPARRTPSWRALLREKGPHGSQSSSHCSLSAPKLLYREVGSSCLGSVSYSMKCVSIKRFLKI